MKIILLHYSAPPIVGGVESVIGHHARLMADDGHDVCIVAGRGEQIDERVGFVQVPLADSRHPELLSIKESLDQGIVPDDFYPRVNELTTTLREVVSGADCLIAHNVCSLNKNLVLTAALKRISEEESHPRMILWHHDLAWTTPRYRRELHEGAPWDLLRTAWPGVEQVTISGFRRQELASLMKIDEANIRVIPNGVELSRFLKLEKLTINLMEQLDLLNGNPILLLPVRITPRKNIELALQVIAEMRNQYPRVTLIVTGPLGPHNPANVEYFGRLQALRQELLLGKNVFFLTELVEGYLPDEVVSDFYQLADVLFLPSREEGFGIPVLEAGLVRMPIFCADIPPLRDLGLKYVHYFSPDGSAAEIASTIQEYLAASSVGGFRTHVRSHYAWREIYRKQIDVLIGKGAE
jgi:glycosyltransferase involved in cell wall biosynthesis